MVGDVLISQTRGEQGRSLVGIQQTEDLIDLREQVVTSLV
jgi:hypothetical protein